MQTDITKPPTWAQTHIAALEADRDALRRLIMRMDKSTDWAIVLLRATLALLKACNEGPYVKDALATIVFYDDAECDGTCLMEDIEILLEEIDQVKP
jgi:hypothetical protein